MAVITEQIPKQNFEIVGEVIGDILTVELAAQKASFGLPEDVTVFQERIVAIDKTEEVVVNVLLDATNSNYASQSNQQNRTNYFIDVYAQGKQTDDDRGDAIAGAKAKSYLGKIRYILQSHKYVTLGLPAGTIGGTNVDNIQMFEQQNTPDANFGRMGRINFSVRIMEHQDLWNGLALDDNLTTALLEETDKGYQYKLKA